MYTSAANDGCETGEVRLAGGVANSSSGLVELCVAGVWGTIHDVNSVWSYENAAVVCHQLNLPDDGETLFLLLSFFTKCFDGVVRGLQTAIIGVGVCLQSPSSPG